MKEKIYIKGKFSKYNFFSITLIIMGWYGILVCMLYFSSDEKIGFFLSVLITAICFSGAIFFYYLLNKCQIIVTNKRVCGKSLFGRNINFSLDKIAFVKTSALDGIIIATPSAKIAFFYCINRIEIFNVISNLLSERQNTANQYTILSIADEIKKYKELLNCGAITQEEFNAKKNQLLSL